ncbi:hypothetical protein EMIT0194P_30153 [Pseudomonas serbica]
MSSIQAKSNFSYNFGAVPKNLFSRSTMTGREVPSGVGNRKRDVTLVFCSLANATLPLFVRPCAA